MKFKTIKLNYKATIAILTTMIILLTTLTITTVRASEDEGTRVIIVMYHSVLSSRVGEYIISPAQLEADFKYIQERGYETIVMADLIAYVYEGRPLPEKPIMLTFDDGFYNNLHYVVPLLEKYNMRAVFSLVGVYTDIFSEADEENINYGHFRWKDIKAIIPTGVVEFQNHSYDLHRIENGQKGAKRRRGESVEDYRERLGEDLMKMQRKFQGNTFFTPTTFTYPYGAFSRETVEIIRDLGFKASLACESGPNYIVQGDKDGLFGLRRYNRDGRNTTKRFFGKILE